MSVDYDLIVIGNSPAAMQAAATAANWRSRVALVTQGADFTPELSNRQGLLEMARLLEQKQRATQLGGGDGQSEPIWAGIDRWLQAIALSLETLHSPDLLAAQGVEVIQGWGEFHRKPVPGFRVKGRSLRSRAYLLAPHYSPVVPAIDGLSGVNYLTPQTLPQHLPSLHPGRHFAIVGADPIGVELAQVLIRLGQSVTLIVPSDRILPLEDPDVGHLLQTRLEAEGVVIYSRTPVTQIRSIQGKTWIQAGNQAIEADEVVLTWGQQPDLAPLNLEAVNVSVTDGNITVNSKRQTTNPRIYACSSPQGDLTPQGDTYRAAIATRNALFLPLSTAHAPVPHVLHTFPEMARVGLTEQEGRERYGKQIVILKQHLKDLPRAHFSSELSGFCKFVLHRNGKILGAHLVMPQAGELIAAIAIALQQHLKIQNLAHLPLPSPSYAEILNQAALEWERLRFKQNPGRQDFWEGFFSFRRSWS
jgi:pyruvate/2-oxoglutarate dehydrogenase complex dihydrolipoamide dehydrogenase (E3) component